MTMLVSLLHEYAKAFDDETYPTEVYFSLLSEVREARTPEELGNALCLALAWKDGKVRVDASGPFTAKFSNTRYRAERTKPHTLNDEHAKTLTSSAFLNGQPMCVR
ncbi:hypothetical protein BZM26_28960 [Paraburkholderia strydomiana]|nr:hypothetical protein BZM26_28960 [Paraburkholderia strydomiana]